MPAHGVFKLKSPSQAAVESESHTYEKYSQPWTTGGPTHPGKSSSELTVQKKNFIAHLPESWLDLLPWILSWLLLLYCGLYSYATQGYLNLLKYFSRGSWQLNSIHWPPGNSHSLLAFLFKERRTFKNRKWTMSPLRGQLLWPQGRRSTRTQNKKLARQSVEPRDKCVCYCMCV